MANDRLLTLAQRQWRQRCRKAVSVALGLLLCGTLLGSGNTPHPLDDIRQTAENFVLQQVQALGYANPSAQAAALDPRLRLAACEQALEAFATSVPARAGRTSVGIRCNGSQPWTLYVPVTMSATTHAVMVSEALPRGTVLSDAHVVEVEADLQNLPPRYLESLDSALGRELTRPVASQTVLTLGMVREPELISKGQEVVISAGGEGFRVRMAGTALQNGKLGERITVRNENSGRTVQGVIRDGATVEVSR